MLDLALPSQQTIRNAACSLPAEVVYTQAAGAIGSVVGSYVSGQIGAAAGGVGGLALIPPGAVIGGFVAGAAASSARQNLCEGKIDLGKVVFDGLTAMPIAVWLVNSVRLSRLQKLDQNAQNLLTGLVKFTRYAEDMVTRFAKNSNLTFGKAWPGTDLSLESAKLLVVKFLDRLATAVSKEGSLGLLNDKQTRQNCMAEVVKDFKETSDPNLTASWDKIANDILTMVDTVAKTFDY